MKKELIKFDTFITEKGLNRDSFKEMSAEKQAEFYNEYEEAVKSQLLEAIETKATNEDLKVLKQQLVDEIVDVRTVLNKLSETPSEEVKPKSIKEQLLAQKDKLTAYKNGDKSARIVIKTVGDMSLTDNVTGQVPQAERITGLNVIPNRQVRFLDVLTAGNISSNLIEWVYQSAPEGSAGQTAEKLAKNQIDFNILVGSQKVEKTTAYIRVTDEMLDDIDFMASEINNELSRKLLQAVETGAYSGDGNSPNLNGVRTVATAFSAGDFAAAIDNANEVDVLVVAANQIAIANQEAPNYIFMHPTDVTKLKVTKLSSSDKRYVERLMMIGGSLSMDGIPIVPTTLVTAGQYLIGDFSKANIRTKQGVEIEIGYNADDFTKNFKTVRAEWRGVVFVKNNDRTAFVKGVFATDKAALETT
jgi:hypothetical protein